MFESITDLVSGSDWTYVAIFLVAAVDAFFPLVPSETMVVTGGVLAASGDLSLSLLILVAALGAVVGDNISYGIGRTAGQRLRPRLFAGKRKRHLDRAERLLQQRGGYLIVIARFIPGGRTATTFAAGLLRMYWPRFLTWDAFAGIIWASYASLIGFFGGKAFEDDPLRGIILALGIAFAIAAGVELFRWLRQRRRTSSAEPVEDALDSHS